MAYNDFILSEKRRREIVDNIEGMAESFGDDSFCEEVIDEYSGDEE